jgi:hypothetical protein
MRPEALAACGDWIENTTIRFHYGAAHMIVVTGELDVELIERALMHLDAVGELKNCSLPLGE